MKRILSLLLSSSLCACGETPPNVLVILIDDLGYHDLSSTGSKIFETPNIDGLARQSYSFRNAYASYPRVVSSLPLCGG
ncbi:MAG: sulfatase-like hydrolase/transferase [Bacteroidales bacterium]